MRGQLVQGLWTPEGSIYAPARFRRPCRYDAFVPESVADFNDPVPGELAGGAGCTFSASAAVHQQLASRMPWRPRTAIDLWGGCDFFSRYWSCTRTRTLSVSCYLYRRRFIRCTRRKSESRCFRAPPAISSTYVATEVYDRNPIGFAINRALRIYPLYIVAYIGALAILAAGIGPVKDLPPFSNEGLNWADYLQGLSIFGALANHRALKPTSRHGPSSPSGLRRCRVLSGSLLRRPNAPRLPVHRVPFSASRCTSRPASVGCSSHNLPGTFIWSLFLDWMAQLQHRGRQP